MKYLGCLIPRLEGGSLISDPAPYVELAKRGIAGFIVFGAELGALTEGLKALQAASSLPLIIASDLEQGLGQQVRGGTLLPPAAAIEHADALSPGIARRAFALMAREARGAGINTVLAPVLDVDTNPLNPIISTRAFSSKPERVAELGVQMIQELRGAGLLSCGKHYPGHGATSTDSHIGLPRVSKSIDELSSTELVPFVAAIGAGVNMIMTAHISVPALAPGGEPASLSPEAIGLLRNKLVFDGVVITDALDMGGLSALSEKASAEAALLAGNDIVLHPTDPLGTARYLERKSPPWDRAKVEALRRSLGDIAIEQPGTCDSDDATGLVAELNRLALKVIDGETGSAKPMGKDSLLLVLSDNDAKNVYGDDRAVGGPLIGALKKFIPELRHLTASSPGECARFLSEERGNVVVAVFSSVRAYKVARAPWLRECLGALGARATHAISFGPPGLLNNASATTTRVQAWWDAPEMQIMVANYLIKQ